MNKNKLLKGTPAEKVVTIAELNTWFAKYDMQVKQYERAKRLNEVPYIHIDNKVYDTIEALDHEADEKARLLSSLRED
jgi:hypothetical protein